MAKILVLGAGVMGSAFAQLLADAGNDVSLVGTHLDQDIIDTVIDQVLPHGVVAIGHEGQFEFGADAVSTSNKHGGFVFTQVQFEKGTKTTQVTQYLGSQRAFG